MVQFVYLHGFNSAFDPMGEKVITLSQIGKVHGISYDSFASYQSIRDFLISEISNLKIDLDELVFVGTSLGGFWSVEMASFFAVPSIIINPCYDPTNMLLTCVGENVNYKTGEVKIFTTSIADSYKNIKTQDTATMYRPLVLLDMADDVIDSTKTLDIFEKIGCPTVTFANGSHRFDHIVESIVHIQEYLNHCSYVEHLNM